MEISVVMGLLEIIDNPRQDVPLIRRYWRSPLFGFTPDRLAMSLGGMPLGDSMSHWPDDEARTAKRFCRPSRNCGWRGGT